MSTLPLIKLKKKKHIKLKLSLNHSIDADMQVRNELKVLVGLTGKPKPRDEAEIVAKENLYNIRES